MFFVINIPPNTLEILPFQSYSCNKALPCLQDLGNIKLFPNSHHVALAAPGNDENGFITISCCSICT
uniref:Uncharacterized protein n=1 Tax=Kuenenia stuttgartiensis TaxID=174633 RepID=Q1Q6G4_KUEST|nr:unknown protein [Candidatus Kuenenia stuttgartiensis]